MTGDLSFAWDVCVWSDGRLRVHECPVCHALVLAEARPYHETWHATLAVAPTVAQTLHRWGGVITGVERLEGAVFDGAYPGDLPPSAPAATGRRDEFTQRFADAENGPPDR